MSYKIIDARALKKCPKCRRYKTPGGICMCGYDWKKQEAKRQKSKVTQINKHIPRCRVCNAIGDHGGFCKMHLEQQAELSYKKRLESYRVSGKNDFEIDVLTGKIIPELQPKHEENENDEDIPF